MTSNSDTRFTQDSSHEPSKTTADNGAINPSAPSSGTEGWGTTADERAVLSGSNAAATRAGQMKGNPGDQQTEAVLRAGGGAKSASRPMERDESPVRDNQAEKSTRGAPDFSMNTSHGGADRTFRCADAGNADCRWETSGLADDEIVLEVYEHGKANHGWSEWTEAMRSKVKDAIRYRDAA